MPSKTTEEKETASKPLKELIKTVNKIIESNHDEKDFADFSYVIQSLKKSNERL